MTNLNDSMLYCANHPKTPTALRCNRCGKPVCSKCIVRTPVGYRCRECVRGQQQVFETAVASDYVITAVIVAPLACLAGFLATSLGFFVIFLAPVVGGLLAELVRAAVRRRRGRRLNWVAAGAFGVGCLPLLLGPLLLVLTGLLGGPDQNLTRMVANVLFSAGLSFMWIVVYGVLGAGALYARLRGISIG
jgi:MFS family permease